MTFAEPSPGLLGFLEVELGRQRQVVAVEVARLAGLEDLIALVFSVNAQHGEGFHVEDYDHLERLVGGDHVAVARLDDLLQRARPTRRST